MWHCNYDINGEKKNGPFPFLCPFIDLLCLFPSWYGEINLIIPSKMYCPICIFHLHFQRPVGDQPDWQNPASQPELSLTQELFSISLPLSGARVWFTGSLWRWRRGECLCWYLKMAVCQSPCPPAGTVPLVPRLPHYHTLWHVQTENDKRKRK